MYGCIVGRSFNFMSSTSFCGLMNNQILKFVRDTSNHVRQISLGNPRQIPETTSDLGRIIVIHMRLRLTSVVGVPHRETPTRFL